MRDAWSSQRLLVHPLTLTYPAAWHCACNPTAPGAAARTADWLARLGVLNTEEARERLGRLDVGNYAGLPFPLANADCLDIVARFFSLWIIYDDAIEGRGEADEALVEAAVRGDSGLVRHPDPFVRGWAEIAADYRQGRSERWRAMLGRRFRVWLDSVRREVALAEQFQHGIVMPSADEYMNVRIVNIGLWPALGFIEDDLDEELPEALVLHPTMLQIERIAAEIVMLVNDLAGFAKDRRAGWPNVVTCRVVETNRSWSAVFGDMVERHNRRVRELDWLCARFIAETGAQAMLGPWLQRLKYVLYGFAGWHMAANRYQCAHRLDDGSLVTLRVAA